MCFFFPFLFVENRVLGVLSVGEFSNQVELYSDFCTGNTCNCIVWRHLPIRMRVLFKPDFFFPEKGNNEGRKSLRKNTTKNYRNSNAEHPHFLFFKIKTLKNIV